MAGNETPMNIVVYSTLGAVGVIKNQSTLDAIVRLLERGNFRHLLKLALTCKAALKDIIPIVHRIEWNFCKKGIPSQLILRMTCLQTLIVPQDIDNALPALTGHTREDVAAAQALAALTTLVNLDVAGMNLNQEAVERIAKMTRLTDLNMAECNGKTVYDTVITDTLTTLDNLKVLNMNGCQINDRSLRFLSHTTSLTELHLDGAYGDGFSSSLACATGLERLNLNNFGSVSAVPGINKILGALTNLVELELWNTDALAVLNNKVLTGLTRLTRLVISRCMWDERRDTPSATSPAHICSLSRLKYLDLSDNGMNRVSSLVERWEANVDRLVSIEVLILAENGLALTRIPRTAAHMHSRGGELRV